MRDEHVACGGSSCAIGLHAVVDELPELAAHHRRACRRRGPRSAAARRVGTPRAPGTCRPTTRSSAQRAMAGAPDGLGDVGRASRASRRRIRLGRPEPHDARAAPRATLGDVGLRDRARSSAPAANASAHARSCRHAASSVARYASACAASCSRSSAAASSFAVLDDARAHPLARRSRTAGRCVEDAPSVRSSSALTSSPSSFAVASSSLPERERRLERDAVDAVGRAVGSSCRRSSSAPRPLRSASRNALRLGDGLAR